MMSYALTVRHRDLQAEMKEHGLLSATVASNFTKSEVQLDYADTLRLTEILREARRA